MKSLIAATLLLAASSGYAQSQSEQQATEHCRAQTCYLQVIEADGSESFYFNADTIKNNTTIEQKAEESGLNVAVLSPEEYSSAVASNHAKRIVYSLTVMYSWQKCTVGVIGSAGLAGMEGLAFGPWGAAAGALFGGAVGAASFCDF
jgi:hypothetical protein